MTLIIDAQSSGIAGNMIIGALVDLGADSSKLKEVMESSASEFGKVNVSFTKVNKHGIDSTYCKVELLDENKPAHYKDLIAKIDNLNLDKKVKETSKKIFERIAIAESKVHGKSLDEIHFHEVGASDAVGDVIGSVYGYYSLGLDKEEVIGLPIALGGGRVKTAHGILPVPAPAVLEILKDINCVGGPVDSELATPTGCAIYTELCSEFMEFIPEGKIEKIAYGAGKKDFDYPNILRLIKTSETSNSDKIDVIETNIDHLTGEEIGYLFNKLLDEGASDVSITPIIMKKNRQGSLLKVIANPKKRNHLIDVMFREIGTLGIRITPNLHRGIAKREFIKKSVEINGEVFDVTFKVAYVNGEVISNRVEYDDLLKIANKTNIPLREIKKIVSDYND